MARAIPMPTGPTKKTARGLFVRRVIKEFEASNRIAIDDKVARYILDRAIISDRRWEKALEQKRFDPNGVRRALHQSLEAGAVEARRRGLETITYDVGRRALHEIVEHRMNCPFPFLIC